MSGISLNFRQSFVYLLRAQVVFYTIHVQVISRINETEQHSGADALFFFPLSINFVLFFFAFKPPAALMYTHCTPTLKSFFSFLFRGFAYGETGYRDQSQKRITS